MNVRLSLSQDKYFPERLLILLIKLKHKLLNCLEVYNWGFNSMRRISVILGIIVLYASLVSYAEKPLGTYSVAEDAEALYNTNDEFDPMNIIDDVEEGIT